MQTSALLLTYRKQIMAIWVCRNLKKKHVEITAYHNIFGNPQFPTPWYSVNTQKNLYIQREGNLYAQFSILEIPKYSLPL